MKALKRTVFGDPILRQEAQRLSADEILSTEIQELIHDMRSGLETKKYGVGLAAPQVGVGVAISVIDIKPTKARPNSEIFSEVVINPEIIETFGKRTGMWEGCLSFGSGSTLPYAKALRYKKIRVTYLDEYAQKHDKILEGLPAHVFQHETDHLNGILFVDRVKNTKTYMTMGEYIKRYARRTQTK